MKKDKVQKALEREGIDPFFRRKVKFPNKKRRQNKNFCRLKSNLED